jgi:hypothetical protein
MYTDEDGEFFWLIPNIGWSKKGGFSIGLTAVMGIPGIFSVQTGVGYNFKENDFSVYAGASAVFNTVYTSYSTQSGWNAGWSAGISPYMGLPISTNFTSVGVNYNFSGGVWSGNVSAWYVDKATGWTFNPSFSAMIFPEHTTNLVRGQGLKSNEKVFQNFVANGQKQKALDYFGFKGTYAPDKTNGIPATTDPKTGEIFYSDYPFESNFDRLALVADHEMKHSRNVLSGKYKGVQVDGAVKNMEEWNTYLYNYKNQGLYRKHDIPLVSRISSYGPYDVVVTPTGSYPTYFVPKRWHWIYRVPRKW